MRRDEADGTTLSADQESDCASARRIGGSLFPHQLKLTLAGSPPSLRPLYLALPPSQPPNDVIYRSAR